MASVLSMKRLTKNQARLSLVESSLGRQAFTCTRIVRWSVGWGLDEPTPWYIVPRMGLPISSVEVPMFLGDL